MQYQNLVQYIFSDGHEQIADQKKRIIIAKHPSTDYFLVKRKIPLKIRGSVPSLDKLADFSNIPQVRHHLIIFKGFFIFGKHYFSHTPIRAINRNVEFYDIS